MRRARHTDASAPGQAGRRRARRAGRRRSTSAVLAAVVLLPGCGSLTAAELPPAATPDASPPLRATPAGTVTDPLTAAYRTGGRPTDGERGRPTRARDQVEVDLPGVPQATADAGRTTLTLDARDRRLVATGAVTGTIGVGTGPVDVAANGRGVAYVTDVAADGIVVVRLRPTLAVTRRVSLPATGPYAIAYDAVRGRLWVTATQTNELIELAAGTRPRELRRYPSVRRPIGVRVRTDGSIEVAGADGTRQRVTPRG